MKNVLLSGQITRSGSIKPPVIRFSKAAVAKLEGMQKDEEFVGACIQIMLKQFGIPKELYPEFVIRKRTRIVRGAMAVYCANKNFLEISEEVVKKTRARCIGLIRHEIQHLLQYLDIMRTEQVGLKSVKDNVSYLAELKSKSDKRKAVKSGQIFDRYSHCMNRAQFFLEQHNLRKRIMKQLSSIAKTSKSGVLAKRYDKEMNKYNRASLVEISARKAQWETVAAYIKAKKALKAGEKT